MTTLTNCTLILTTGNPFPQQTRCNYYNPIFLDYDTIHISRFLGYLFSFFLTNLLLVDANM